MTGVDRATIFALGCFAALMVFAITEEAQPKSKEKNALTLALALAALIGSVALAYLVVWLNRYQMVSPVVLVSRGVGVIFYPVLLAYAFWQKRGGQKLWVVFGAIGAMTVGILLVQTLFP